MGGLKNRVARAGLAGLMGLLAGLLTLVPALPLSAAERPATIAAAASLRFAMGELEEAFRAETGHRLNTSFAASGILMRQIEAGAPFEVFLAADEAFTTPLDASGRTAEPPTLYALGRLVILTPKASGPAWTIKDLHTRTMASPPARLAIANPETAPYGKAAEQALRSLNLWHPAQPRLVIGENVAQAAQFALSGNAQGGIVALSLALAPAVAPRSHWTLLPQDAYAPVRHTMALIKGAGAPAQAFHAFIQSAPARVILERHGFLAPLTSN